MSANSSKARYAGIVSLVLTLALAIAQPARAEAPTLPTLDLSGFEGKVRLQHSPDGAARVSTEGWKLVEREGALILEEQRVYEESSGGAGCASAVDRPSYPASTRANSGWWGGANRSGAAAQIEIVIPASTRVVARGFAGSLDSSVALVEPRIEVTSGRAALAQVLGGELTVNGPGAITIGQAAGQLNVSVSGAGSIQVQDGRIDQLTATLRGTGSIGHGGVARRAILSASEAGEIRVRGVEEPIRIEQAGLAAITIACRGTTCEPR